MEREQTLTSKHRAVLGAVSCATGVALVIYIVSGVSLAVAGLVLLLVAAAAAVAIWRRLARPEQAEMRRLLLVGVVAGAAGTAAYDLSRYLLVSLFGWEMSPFAALPLFGQALVGAGLSGAWVTAAGISYHIANGVGFGVAYTLWFGRRGPVAGILWALALEAAMLTFYPTWLDIRAWREFVQMSVFGHVAYGATLGLVARRALAFRVAESVS